MAPNTAATVERHIFYTRHLPSTGEKNQHLWELVLCTVQFLAASLPFCSAWKGVLRADKFSPAATFIYLYLLLVKVSVPLSMAWGLFYGFLCSLLPSSPFFLLFCLCSLFLLEVEIAVAGLSLWTRPVYSLWTRLRNCCSSQGTESILLLGWYPDSTNTRFLSDFNGTNIF